ncbi:cysteine--tRNA ligase [Sandaracinus amylolyticus]|uniref:cysteine--tRNA ligase n=1 Tax=Sandaracinus amylolyticus TaxID=927083 RepID=UPI001F02DCF0|nr:cysteine--tRNA ligase [Sandaracinus amylolyticus]UJR79436.1 Cysteinyl-tRNA synthetase [Sandaracinus amylolyticus]
MALVLYNTLTSKKEPFAPQDPSNARIYVCGPTVYDLSHLGHARCYVVYDVLVRHLRARGQTLTYVRNVTDIDDKILARSRQNGETPATLSARMTDAFLEDMDALRNVRPDIEPRVSEHLTEIVALIEKLIEKGAAYAKDGDVYFRVHAFPEYGKLSHRSLEALASGASGRVDESETRKKEDPADFALWKGAPDDEWGWSSPWGHGRPGWHIECSAMSMKHLGETLDLHGGGLDLVFPHHENEIAQSEAATHKPFAKHWMHNGFVEVEKTKMSKSLGNFFTARTLFERHEPEAIRFAMLTVHYRSPLNLDWTLDDAGNVTGFPLFEDAEKRVEYVYTTRQRLASIDPARIVATGEIPEAIARFPQELAGALDDDLNSAIAIATASEMLKQVNELVEQSKRKKGTVARGAIEAAERALAALDTELGIGGQDANAVLLRIRQRRANARGITEAQVEEKIRDRRAARDAKDFARADALRDELVTMGVELMDGPTGTTWRIP